MAVDPRSFGDGYRAGYSAGVETAVKEAAAEYRERHAHWVKFGSSGSEYSDRWQCSSCKGTARAENWGKKCGYERCPHCGAIMDAADDQNGGENE